MMRKRLPWLLVMSLMLAAGAIVIRFVYLERDLRRELADEVSAPLNAARFEIESWNRNRPEGEARITDQTFGAMSIAHRIRNSRTSLLTRRGDSVIVIASAGGDTTRLIRRRFAFNSAPAAVQKALSTRRGIIGAGGGLAYDAVAFASVPVKGTDWVLIREVESYALAERMLGPITLDVVFVASLLLFAYGYLRSKARVSEMKREQELSAVRADFLAAVSHELRTPLAQIRMFAELLKTGSMRQPEETRRALNVIEKESSRLSILVDNVLNYAALHRNTERVPLTERPATEVTRDIEYVLDAFAPLANEKDVKLESSAKQSTTALVNSQALRQILLNLLENAVKYGPRGQTVTIGTDRQTARVKVWVDDQGPGIPAAERASIWLPFKRGSSGTASKTGGSGIGLSVVQDLAEQNDGKAWVEDAPGGGARFIVEFDSIRASSGSAGNGYRREPAVIIPG